MAAIRRKTERAKEHLRNLQNEVSAFLATKPYKVGVKRDPDTRKPIYFVAGVAATPVTLPLIADDVLQNLRSALDHLAYRLEVVGLGSAPSDPRYIAYPICDVEAEYLALRNGRIKNARTDAKSAIDATKPYRGGNDTLWRLHKLNIIDKHRLLLTVGSAFRAVDLGAEMSRMMSDLVRKTFPDKPATFPPMELLVKPADRLFPLKVGDELYIGGVDDPINAEMKFVFDIALGEPGIVEGDRWSRPYIGWRKWWTTWLMDSSHICRSRPPHHQRARGSSHRRHQPRRRSEQAAPVTNWDGARYCPPSGRVA